jgi:predicted PurR-regulated permease PerM
MEAQGISVRVMHSPVRISYGLVVLIMAMAIWLHLGTLILTTLFGYLALQVFCFRGRRVLSVAIYVVLVALVVIGLAYFSSLAYRTFPRIAETAIPAMTAYAEKNGVELPFSDWDSLKSTAMDEAREGVAVVGRYAKIASLQFILLVAGVLVALSLFLSRAWTTETPAPNASPSLYSTVTTELSARFASLYESFAMVMGAQIAISAINTVLTAIFLLLNSYPNALLLLVFVFLCGLVPIVGNLISNGLIVGVGFTVSPHTGLVALVFLVVIHKLEYFLNSKIVGRRIGSPLWLTLIGLVVGERLAGFAGMVLAPVLLHYIRMETSARRVPAE